MSSAVIKTLKVIGTLLLILIGLPLIIALFAPKDFSVERSIVIDRPTDEVFDYIRFLKNQDNYSKWATMDPDMTREFRGTDGTVGFVSAWSGNEDVGRGEQEITAIYEGERIEFALRFFEPFESKADVWLITEAITDDQTRVKWGFDSRMPWPLNLMLIFMDLDEAIGADYEYGLENLKRILEAGESGDNGE